MDKPTLGYYTDVFMAVNDRFLPFWAKKPSKLVDMGNKTQKLLIDELINTKIIIEGGPRNSWDLPLNKKLHLVYNELENNFYESQKIKEWRVFLRQQ